ncbi:MAG: TraB/GumN family protein [Shimia sp.]|nr:TraB/GumN family protein [Shimia sp.]
MRTLLSALAFLLTATVAQAACTGPDAFKLLPEATQTDLRTRAAQAPYSQGILWQVEKNGVTSTLVGTLHIADPVHARTMAALKTRITPPEQVFLELTTQSQTAFQRHLADNPGVYLIEQGDSLIDILGAPHWKTMSAELQKRGLPPFMAARYQPWFLGLTLMMPPCAMADLTAGKKGLDHQIEAFADDAQIPTQSLDSINGLLDILASDPLEKQVEELLWSLELDLYEDTTSQTPAMIALYTAEDIQLIWELSRHQTLSRAKDDSTARELATLMAVVEADLIAKRNHQWAEHLIPALEKTPSLVAVGALHLPGDTGLLRLLENAGYSITRLPLR